MVFDYPGQLTESFAYFDFGARVLTSLMRVLVDHSPSIDVNQNFPNKSKSEFCNSSKAKQARHLNR